MKRYIEEIYVETGRWTTFVDTGTAGPLPPTTDSEGGVGVAKARTLLRGKRPAEGIRVTSGDMVEGADRPYAPDPQCGAVNPANGHTCVLPPGHRWTHRDEQMRGWRWNSKLGKH